MKTTTKRIAIFIATFALVFTSLPMEAHAVSTPPQVKTFNATTYSTTSVRLTWRKPGRASGYAVYVNGKLYKSLSMKNTAYNVPNLRPGTTYKVSIRTYNAYKQTQYYNSKTKKWQTKKPSKAQWKGKKTRKVNARKYSKPSIVRTVRTKALPKPGTITGLNVTKVDKTSISIKWNKLTTNCTAYEVLLNGKVIISPGAGTTTYKIGRLAEGTTYTITVRGYFSNNGKKTYGNSATIKAKTETTPKPKPTPTVTTITPGKITGLTQVNTTSNTIKVSWNKLTSNCSGYEVYLNNKLMAEPNINTVTYTFTNLKANTSYSIQVRGYYLNSNGPTTYGAYASANMTTDVNNDTGSEYNGNNGNNNNQNPISGGNNPPPPNLPSGKNTTGGVYDQRDYDEYVEGEQKWVAVQWAKNNIPNNMPDAQKVVYAIKGTQQLEYAHYNCVWDAATLTYMLDYIGIKSEMRSCQYDVDYGIPKLRNHVNNLVWIDGVPYVVDAGQVAGTYGYVDGHISTQFINGYNPFAQYWFAGPL